ncbi:hypothetical protein Airi02_079590 [Actinoallomurus iriomotensis]|uniref:Uncharacterized protein n=1 Tax=Actinoallomurus iriomotensis TaxID=478107 RepID=A0A9W6S801_9ACTN|nr:hypothetical protein Airi02_079590 [Actinoallomurus iriomotensis]
MAPIVGVKDRNGLDGVTARQGAPGRPQRGNGSEGGTSAGSRAGRSDFCQPGPIETDGLSTTHREVPR